MSVVIQVDRLSKQYRLGTIGGKRLVDDVNRWWARFRGKEDPLSKVGQPKAENRKQKAETPGDSVSKSQVSTFNFPISVLNSPSSVLRPPTSDTIWALKDVSFEVKQGEVLGIIGRNGAGKSTLLKILSRVTGPTSGEVRVKGRIASLLEVGTGFHPELTGRENIFLNGAILGMTKLEIRSRFDQIVAFSDVNQFIDTPVKRYSSGMTVRLAFAVAAHLEPEILIVDEVLAVGDAAFQKKCLGKMREVAEHGRTVLFVSHNMAAVDNLCNSGILLINGCVAFAGKHREAISQYLTAQALKDEPLRHRTDRSGSGEIRIVSVALKDAEGTPIEVAISGMTLDVWLHFEKSPICSAKNIVVSIQVHTSLGTRVFLQHSRLTGATFQDLPNGGAFVCRIKRLPLPSSTYRIDCCLTADNGRGHYLDFLEHAADMTVSDGDFYGSGEVPPVTHGICLVDASWRLETT
jgi:lipopolysaccharide transport system ATP-binding protein